MPVHSVQRLFLFKKNPSSFVILEMMYLYLLDRPYMKLGNAVQQKSA
jgi:hypothetical protein